MIMKIGASTSCLYPMYTEDSLSALLSMGARDLEIFFNTQSETEAGYLCELRARLDDAGAGVLSVHPYTSGMEQFMLFTPYQRRFDDMIEFFKRTYFEAANYLSAGILALHGGRTPGVLGDEEYFCRMGAIIEAGWEHGVNVCHENVKLHRGSDPDFLCRMREYLGGQANFVFDIKQAVRAGHDPYEFLEKVAPGVVHVHVNDNAPGRDCLLPGQGEMDYKRLRDILLRHKADGKPEPGWVIEVYRCNFGKQKEVESSLRWLRAELEVKKEGAGNRTLHNKAT